MPLKNIIFRADGGSIVGMGHFIRTLALAEMLKEDFYCIYATQSPSAYQINAIEKVCQEWINLPSDESHFPIFLNLLKGDEIVVLDNYYYTTDYQHCIKSKGCKLVCIDDMHDKHFIADVIINHAEGISESHYIAKKHTKFCLGYQFALLRKEYLIEINNQSSKKYSCLVILGGADPLNLTAKIISMIVPLKFQLSIAVVVGAGYNNEHLFKPFNNVELFKGIESSKVFQLMQESELGIFSASTIAIEAIAARLPFICGYYVDNQKEIYLGIETNNLAICVGNYLQTSPNDFANAFKQLSIKEIADRIVMKQKTLLDKKSKDRFIKTFNSL